MSLGVALAVGGAVLQGYGAYKGIQANSQQARHMRRMYLLNMALAKDRAKSVIAQGESDAVKYTNDAAGFISDQVVAYDKSGIDVGSGVVSEVVDSTARTAASDAENIRRNAKKSAWGILQEAKVYGMKADMAGAEARAYDQYAPLYLAGTALGLGSAFV